MLLVVIQNIYVYVWNISNFGNIKWSLTAGVFHLCYAFMLYISHIVTEENN